jgi:hypothetical protein
MTKPKRVGEPVQVYLNDRDRTLLDELAARSDLARAEVMRVALRRLAADLPGATNVGAALPTLVGVLDSAKSIPVDLAARHDEYLYAVRERPPAPRAPRKPRKGPKR